MKSNFKLITFKFLIPGIAVALVMVSCVFTTSGSEEHESYTKEELTGDWTTTNPIKETDTDTLIQSFKLLDDETAVITLITSDGEQEVNGNWKPDVKKEVGFIEFESELQLSYYTNPNHLQMIFGDVKSNAGSLTFEANGLKFKKE